MPEKVERFNGAPTAQLTETRSFVVSEAASLHLFERGDQTAVIEPEGRARTARMEEQPFERQGFLRGGRFVPELVNCRRQDGGGKTRTRSTRHREAARTDLTKQAQLCQRAVKGVLDRPTPIAPGRQIRAKEDIHITPKRRGRDSAAGPSFGPTLTATRSAQVPNKPPNEFFTGETAVRKTRERQVPSRSRRWRVGELPVEDPECCGVLEIRVGPVQTV